MERETIKLPGYRKRKPPIADRTIRISSEAYVLLMEFEKVSPLSMAQIASKIILESAAYVEIVEDEIF